MMIFPFPTGTRQTVLQFLQTKYLWSLSARRAREEIDRFNAGIANILSFGVDAKGGGGK